jgi:hypothetical protein
MTKKNESEDLNLLGAFAHCRSINLDLGAVASAIELEGIYTWDKYGRFHHAKPDTDGANEALKTLAEYQNTLDEAKYDGSQEAALDYYWEVEGSPLERFLWPKDKHPDFKASQKQWNEKNLGAGIEPAPSPEISPAPQAKGLNKIMRGLIIKAFGEDIFIELAKSKRSDKTQVIASSLSGEAITVSRDDVNKWIAHPIRHLEETSEYLIEDFLKRHPKE